MADEQVGLTVTTSDASETIIINNDPPAPTKPTKGVTNVDAP
jgi:hypothetical protein